MSTELAPGFLVAAPALQCPFFHHTLVLMVDHGEEGSFGFVVNKTSDVSFARVLDEVGLASAAAQSTDAGVLIGGPVQPETGWVVFDPQGPQRSVDDAIDVSERLGVSASLAMLTAIAAGEGPAHCMLVLGYAGWGPGQLEAEMREGSWFPVDLQEDLLFATPVEDRWSAALRSLGVDPARVVGTTVANA